MNKITIDPADFTISYKVIEKYLKDNEFEVVQTDTDITITKDNEIVATISIDVIDKYLTSIPHISYIMVIRTYNTYKDKLSSICRTKAETALKTQNLILYIYGLRFLFKKLIN